MQLTNPQKLIYDMERFAGGAISIVCGSMLINTDKSVAEMKKAVNELYRLNDALRIRVAEENGQPYQYITEYTEQDIEVLSFNSKEELDNYASEYAKEPLDFYGSLCDVKIVVLPDRKGLLAKLHHFISDAWTLSLIGTQFNKLLNGEEVQVYSYTDYIDAETQYMESKRFAKDKDYFFSQFKKCDEVTYLSDAQSHTYDAKRATYIIDQDKTAKISAFTSEHGTTVFNLFMAALAIYINRIKMNAEKFYIGTAVLNRNGIKEQNTMGMFINTAPVLFELTNEGSFAENLESVQDSIISVLRHQKYNYGTLLEELRRNHSFSEKLYDVMLSYQNAKVLGGEIETTWYHSGMQTESLQIHIDDRDDEGIFRVHYDYLSEKFTEYEIEKLHEHICNLLFSAIKDDNKKIYELTILSAEEKQTLMFDFNDTAVDYPRDNCVYNLFEEQVTKHPAKTAVVFKSIRLSYSELLYLVEEYAGKLNFLGIKENDTVAIHLDRSQKLIILQLAVLKIGAIFLPLDKRYPEERINYACIDCNVKLLIADSKIKADTNVIDITEFESVISNKTKTIINKDSCYIIYTSGSTGRPKGCLLTGNGLLNFCQNNNTLETLNKQEDCIFACVNTVSFDYFIAESLLPLINGFTTVVLDDNESTVQDKFLFVVKKNNINVVMTTPTRLKLYYDDNGDTDILRQINCICTSGEPLSAELLIKMYEKSPKSKVYNPIGPSECSVWDIGGNLNREDGIDIHIGKPIANAQIYITDRYMNLVPIGVIGEICIAGDGVGKGYINNPVLTQEKFINNPFGEGKFYKTGDLAYWREDGNIAYVGRNDFQVKIRGLRIELGEIENAICSVEGINMSVVVVRKNNEGRQLICAFYTGEEKSAQEIKSVIGEKLPKYMLPHIFTHLDEMPLTSSGKISRKTLPEIDLENIETTVEFVAPKTEEEQVLVECIKTTLGGEKVSTLDNFFDIGGDSLKAIELTSQLESKGYDVQVRTIFDCETIQELAKELSAKAVETTKVEYGHIIPATPAQMRVYTAQSKNSDSTLYNIPYVFKVESLDVERLQIAINKLIERHESLRTHFENQNGHIMQVIDGTASVAVERLSNDDILSFIRPFDLEKSSLIRVGYYENIVMIDIHHIISDGGTMPVLFKELNELYMGRDISTDVVQYGEFAVQEVNLEESEKYWLSVFDDEIPVLELPTDTQRTDKQSFNGNSVYDVIDIGLHNKIAEKCKELNITPYVFYMTCFNILLAKFSGNEDIVVGMPVSGRSSHFLNTIGMFVNTIALRNKPEGNKNIIEFLNEVKVNSISAIDNQNYPFGELVKKLGIETSGRNPLFDVMFAYQSEQMTDVFFGDKKAELLPVPITSAKCDFTFNIMPRNDGVVVMVEYCTDLYKEQKIQKFINAFKLILEQCLDEKSLIQDIEVMSIKEKNILLFDFNDTAVDYPRDKCVHELFEEQVAKTPDKIAVVACDKTLTYAELNGVANRVAHSLIEKGIGRGDIVAFMLPRRSCLIATMLGILKSGAAYMPIDPDYPQNRIEYMLTESRAIYCVNVINFDELTANSNVTNLNKYVDSTDVFCALHTSGSTGKPKMSLLKHGGMMNFAIANSRFWQNIDAVVSATIVTFDAFQMDTVLSLAQGKKLILANEDEIYNQILFEKLFEYSDSNMFFSTPTKIKNYIECSADKMYITKIKNFVIGGEVFSEQLLDSIKEISPENNVYNVYGPTETTICVLVDALEKDRIITIGKPIANTQIYIVDKYSKPVPIGVTGELCIAGDCVGAGYLNRPELTAEKFVDNPFGKGKMYKTGDLAYWREDGNIAYVGRNDFQVKIRGLRIELGEIENAISSVEGINLSVVVVRKNSEGRQLICAFYTGEEKSAQEIKSVIGEKLPKYMLPHIFTHLDEMPLTSSGKISRKTLPEIDLENISNDTEYVAPITETEKLLCSIVSETLGIEKIGVEDDFFEFGGDSLKAIEYVSKAHAQGVYFALQDVFDNPTVKLLCKFMTVKDKQHNTYNIEDFKEIHKMLESNLDDEFVPAKSDMGDVLVTGATGFLGIHVVSEFIENESGKVYCLVRGKDNENATDRFRKLLNYYFDGKYVDLIGSRIIVLCGDVEKENLGLDVIPEVSMVINTAASVKHYGSYKYFHDINVGGAINSMNVAKAVDARFIQVSTLSVSGNSMVDIFDAIRSEEYKTFSENDLYIEQQLDNVYIRSKFEAEYAILKEMLNGLKANIIRVGNLTNRASDFKFQPNYQSNAFLSRVKAVLVMGMFPDYLIDLYAEFSPIDDTAKAVIKIAQHFNDRKTVFHVNSQKVVYFDKFIEYTGKLGINLDVLTGKEFADRLAELEHNETTRYIYEALINDMDENGNLVYDSNIHIENEHTLKYLDKIGFDWSEIGLDYLKGYFDYFRKLGYLEV